MLVLLIAAVGVHLALIGLGLVFFGAGGLRARTASRTRATRSATLVVPGQALWIVGADLAAMAALCAVLRPHAGGKALRATAVNRLGARLVGIPTVAVGPHRLRLGRAASAQSRAC